SYSVEQCVQECRILACSSRVECIKKSSLRLDPIGGVQIDTAPELGAFRSDVADLDDRVLRDFPFNLKVPVLRIWSHLLVSRDSQRSVRCENGEGSRVGRT